MGASHVLKGNQRAGGNNLATHLMNEFDNEHRGKMYGCNLYLGDGHRRFGIGGPCMNLGRTQTKSHVHPTPRSCADITYNRSTRYSGLEDYFGHRRPPFMKLTDSSGNRSRASPVLRSWAAYFTVHRRIHRSEAAVCITPSW
jgi:hypothetical protein